MIAELDIQDAPVTVDSDGENVFAHIAEAAILTEAYVNGTAIMALCGYIFVPHRDPEKYPVCKECKDTLDALYLSI
jgi:hypothetical protein